MCGAPLLWHPAGTSLVCRLTDSTTSTDTEDLVRVSREGEVLARYNGMPVGWTAGLSPDGSRIYLAGTHRGSKGVWWIPANGGDLTKVVAFDDPSLVVPWDAFSVGDGHLYITLVRYESDIHVMDLEW